MTEAEITVRYLEGQFYVSVHSRLETFHPCCLYEGFGDTLSEAFSDLADVLANAGL